jgi:tetratricopeptide (TPR) repeat protein
MRQEQAFSALAAFLSRLDLERLARTETPEVRPSVDRFEGVLLWTDVSGFTPLVERVGREGSNGAERLSDAFTAHFGRLIVVSEAEGGDLLFLAGDGALSLFRPFAEEDLASTAERALTAGRAVLRALDGSRPQPDIRLRLRAVVASGSLAAFTVGAVGDRWLHPVMGSVIEEIGAAASMAAPGELAIAGSAAALLAARRPDRTASSTNASSSGGRARPAHAPLVLEPSRLLPHVLSPVAARIMAGHSDFLAEFRIVTVVFTDLSALGAACELDRLQDVVVRVQTTAADFEGTIYQLVQDDKGTGVIVAFGLPGYSHEDDPVRAVRFARALQSELLPLLGTASCGISTGQAFCGPCGLSRRSQYAIYGRPMNRAARLMAAAGGTIMLDEATHRVASRRLALDVARQVAVKGVDDPLRAYVAGGAASASVTLGGLVGRKEERGLLERRLAELCDRGSTASVVIEGPPGIGKTSLLLELRQACAARGGAWSWGSADFVEQRTPLFGLRTIFRGFLGIDAGSTSAEVDRRIGEALGRLGESVELLPLMHQALGVSTVETELTRQMTPAVRSENRNRLLRTLAAHAGRARPSLVVLDDLQWIDAATSTLLPQLMELPGLLWVLACRTDGPAPELLERLPARTTRMILSGLGPTEIAAVTAATLGTDTVPESVVGLLVERAGGNPLYSLELALSLRETGRVQVAGGRCRIEESFGRDAGKDLPTSLSALIKSRVDRLPQAAQITLRVASVLGPSFERRVLTEVLRSTSVTSGGELDVLEREGFLRPDSTPGEPRYTFRHATIQGVAYELMPPRQRAFLHRAAAMALETIYGMAPIVYGRLSHHWNEARDAAKTSVYSALAARQALDGYANQDAVELFRRAIENQRPAVGPDEISVERARLYTGLARAHYSLTQPKEAREAFEAALRHVGYPNPGGGLEILVGIGRHLTHTLRRNAGASAEATGASRERCLATLDLLAEWVTLDFWEGRPTEGAAKALLGHRLAQSVLSTSLAAEAVSRLGYVLAVTPLRFLAERELLQSVELAKASGDMQAVASSRVLLGMYYTLDGRAAKAIRPLQEAQAPAERLGAGLWRHRTRFMLGETLLCLGRFDEARTAFARAADLSIGAERPVVGLSTAMGALALTRLGGLDEALALIDGRHGLPLIEDSYLPLQRFTSLGIKVEILTLLGRPDEAAAIAREAQALAAHGQDCDVFFAALHGHAGVAQWNLALLDRALTRPRSRRGEVRALSEAALAACRRIRRFARMYPAARPRADLLASHWLVLVGQRRKARSLLERALSDSTRMEMPFEQALAHGWLSSLESASASTRHLQRMRALCGEFSMSERAMTAAAIRGERSSS